jgi:enoyl-CoA hydratase/carnithine racemase
MWVDYRAAMTDKFENISVSFEGEHIAVVKLERENKLNALNLATRKDLAAAFMQLGENEQVRVIVLTGGAKAFAAGADIKEFIDAGPIELIKRRVEQYWRVISQVPQPVIAAVNGFALGGGFELAMVCDIIVAGEGAKFGQPEIRIGIMPGSGGTQRILRTAGKYHAMRLCLTGERISAQEAHAMGLVSNLVADDQVMMKALEMAASIASMPPLAAQQIKEVILQGADASLEAGLLMERRMMQILFASEDKTEGMQAFFDKRQPDFKGE